MENNRIQDLESKAWYRALQIIGYFILGGAILAPVFYVKNINNDGILVPWLIDAFINTFAWVFIMAICKASIVYIVYGRNHKIINKITTK
jgi:hypothetical protein